MAEPVSFFEASLTIVKPNAGVDGMMGCSLVGVGAAGGHVTCWKFSLIELAEILRNEGRIWVTVKGAGEQPEMVVSGYKPAL
jgi:hypothetical protein